MKVDKAQKAFLWQENGPFPLRQCSSMLGPMAWWTEYQPHVSLHLLLCTHIFGAVHKQHNHTQKPRSWLPYTFQVYKTFKSPKIQFNALRKGKREIFFPPPSAFQILWDLVGFLFLYILTLLVFQETSCSQAPPKPVTHVCFSYKSRLDLSPLSVFVCSVSALFLLV